MNFYAHVIVVIASWIINGAIIVITSMPVLQ